MIKVKNIIQEEILINELLISNEYKNVNSLDSTTFVVYIDKIYFFDYTNKSYINDVKNFAQMMAANEKIQSNVGDFDSAGDFLKYDLKNRPNIIVGSFVYNSFSDDIPKDALCAEFEKNSYLDISISDTLRKIIKVLPMLNYFHIDNKYYSKEDLLNSTENNNKQIKLPELVYHGTSSENILEILRRGIITVPENSPFNDVKHDKYIFLTSSFKTANNYAEMSVSRNYNLKTFNIVLEIPTSRLDKDKIEYDLDFYAKYVGNGNDEYDKIIKNDNPKQELMYSNKPDKNLGAKYNKFGYNGIILPTKISNIFAKIGNDYSKFTIQEFINYTKTKSMNEAVEQPIIRGKIFESIDVYHGSDRKFDVFDMSKIGSGDGNSKGGWGIYFSDNEDVSRSYSTNRGFVKQYRLKNGNYFNLDESLDYSVANLILNKMKKTRIKKSDIEEFESDFIEYANETTNKQVYDWLSFVCGSEKNASLFLYSIGFIGNTFSDRTNREATNYVVFDTHSIIYI